MYLLALLKMKMKKLLRCFHALLKLSILSYYIGAKLDAMPSSHQIAARNVVFLFVYLHYFFSLNFCSIFYGSLEISNSPLVVFVEPLLQCPRDYTIFISFGWVEMDIDKEVGRNWMTRTFKLVSVFAAHWQKGNCKDSICKPMDTILWSASTPKREHTDLICEECMG